LQLSRLTDNAVDIYNIIYGGRCPIVNTMHEAGDDIFRNEESFATLRSCEESLLRYESRESGLLEAGGNKGIGFHFLEDNQ
jgi:hypothetical protein